MNEIKEVDPKSIMEYNEKREYNSMKTISTQTESTIYTQNHTQSSNLYNTKRRSIAVGTFESFDNSHSRLSKNNDDDGESDINQFRKLYPHIQKSQYSKLCLPPTCQYIPMTQRSPKNQIHKNPYSSIQRPTLNPLFFHMPILNKLMSLWKAQYDYWTKFWFLFLPSGGSIIWKMIFKNNIENDDTEHEITEPKLKYKKDHDNESVSSFRSLHDDSEDIQSLYQSNRIKTKTKKHPHISTIFPNFTYSSFDSSTSSNIGLPINDNTPTSYDPPMNFFDAETSSDGIQHLTQNLPVVPDKNGYILCNKPNTTPLLVFVNSKSGPQQGHVLLNQLRRLLNPIQVWDLADGDPDAILESFLILKNLRILVCGGDGTVSWILSTMEKKQLERWPSVAILPLGTGNDLARIHGWGGGYSNESLLRILKQVQEAYVSLLDRWDLTVKDKKGNIKVQKCFTNYLGVGVDAQVAYQMHTLRESKPKLFFSRAINKAWYGIFGAEDAFKATNAGLTEKITLIADGVEIPLPPDSQGIIFLNIDSYSGGTSLWKPNKIQKKKRRYSYGDGIFHFTEHESPLLFGDGYGYGLTFPSATQRHKRNSRSSPYLIDRIDSIDESESDARADTPDEKYNKVTACDLPSSCQDGLLDVVSVRSAFHLGQIRVGLSTAQTICQCHQAIISTKKHVAVQVDGEPWKQKGPSTLKITRKKDPAIMLHRAADDGGGVETEMAKLLDWAEERHIIDRKAHSILMKEFSRRIESKTRQRRVESQDNLMFSLTRAISNNNF